MRLSFPSICMNCFRHVDFHGFCDGRKSTFRIVVSLIEPEQFLSRACDGVESCFRGKSIIEVRSFHAVANLLAHVAVPILLGRGPNLQAQSPLPIERPLSSLDRHRLRT